MADIKNILVIPAGTEIALEINNALRYSKFVKLFGATGEKCHAEFAFENCETGVPYTDSEKFIDSVNEIVDKYHIDYIYPAHDSVLLKLTQQRDKLHAELVSSCLETVEITRSKNKTYKYLADAPYLPRNYRNAAEVESYPVFIKPSVGQGSNGARRIDSPKALNEALSEGVEYAICEYLPGKEYTVDCFTDRHGVLRLVSPRTRARIRAGISVRSERVECSDNILSIAEDINSRFSFNGAWFFQIKENSKGEYRLMEIAPRIAGTMSVTRNCGINLPLLTLYNMWGFDVDILDNRNAILLDRAFISRFKTDISYDKVYVDFDDTLLVNGKVNGMLMMFLYQARNKGKKIFLLTKHAHNIYESLDYYGISPKLFDEIIHTPQNDKKTDYIKPNSIFIDDSFAERSAVSRECGIAVFDLDMVESLLDWRI